MPILPAKPPGVLRIACFGGSTTEGGNPDGLQGSFPFHLQRLLHAVSSRPIEVVNFGVSGWTTAESLICWILEGQDYAPDVVIIHHAANDVEPRMRQGFRTDYAHWRRPWTAPHFGFVYRLLVRSSLAFAWTQLPDAGRFRLDRFVERDTPRVSRPPGAPLPAGTDRAFRRNVRTMIRLARDTGARTMLATMPYDPNAETAGRSFEVYRRGIDEHNAILRRLAREEEGVLLADLDLRFRQHPGVVLPEFRDLVHLTARGNRIKAQLLAARLVEGHLVPLDESPAPR